MGKTIKTIGYVLFGIIVISFIQFTIRTIQIRERGEFVKEIASLSTIDEARTGYMSTCAEDSRLEPYCACVFDYIVNRIGVEGIMDMALDYLDDEEMPEMMVDAAIECIATLR